MLAMSTNGGCCPTPSDMSSSWNEERRPRHHRRPRRSAVPIEINTSPETPCPPRSLVSHASSGKKKQENKVPDESLWDCRIRERVQILPGSHLIPEGEPWRHPLEPREPPPLPTDIVQFLVIGEHQSGKTSLTNRFLRRHYVHTLKEKHSRKGGDQSEWSVEYHKKDVTFWHSDDTVGSARVQLWDVTGGGPSERPLERRQEWIRLVQKMSGILLVISLEHGSDVLFEKVVSWKQWLDECCPSHPQVHLFLQKSDLLPRQHVDPLVWMHLGSRLSTLCDETGISDCRLTTCSDGRAQQSSLPEQAIMELVRSIVMTEVAQRRNQPRMNPTVSRVGRSRAKSGTKFRTDYARTVLEAKAVPISLH